MHRSTEGRRHVSIGAGLSILLPAAALALPPAAHAQGSPSPNPAPAAAQPAAAPAVAPEADRLLKQMSAYLGSAAQFTFHADVTFDHVLPSGQKLQYAAEEDVALKRPDGLYVEWRGDLGNRQFWYDGKSVTLADPATPFYGSQSAPQGIDPMLGMLVGELGFTPPLADFLYSDPFGAVRSDLQYGLYLGATDVNGRRCDALAFVQKDIDWQIWIDTGPQLTPCKLVITYKAQPGQPQFAAVFSDWDFAPRIAAPVFDASLPPGAQRIPFLPLVAASNSK